MRKEILASVSQDLLSISPLIFRSIRRTLIRTNTFDPDLNITPLHYEIVRLLKSEGTLHVSEIGDKLQIARAQMTKLIDKLVNLGFVARTPDKNDRRILNISLTEQGNRIFDENQKQVTRAVEDVLSALSDSDLEILSQSLHTMQNILLKA